MCWVFRFWVYGNKSKRSLRNAAGSVCCAMRRQAMKSLLDSCACNGVGVCVVDGLATCHWGDAGAAGSLASKPFWVRAPTLNSSLEPPGAAKRSVPLPPIQLHHRVPADNIVPLVGTGPCLRQGLLNPKS